MEFIGGQSENPAVNFYDNAVDTWVSGNIYQLWLMKKERRKNSRIKSGSCSSITSNI